MSIAEPTAAERAASVPANRVQNRQALGPGRDLDAETGEVLPNIPTLIEVERTIMAIDAKLDDIVIDYAQLSEAEASARADWEEHRDRVYLSLHRSGEWKSEAVAMAEAKMATAASGRPGELLYRSSLTLKSAVDSCGKHMGTLQTRSSVQQSLLKHLRQVAGFDS